MGSNKALLNIGGKLIIRGLIDCILPITQQIYISSNDPFSYQFLGFPIIPDNFAGHGPLAGFHSAMIRNIGALYIMLACDLPNLKTQFLHRIVALGDGFDAAIPRSSDGLAHPLCAVYRDTCLPFIESALQRNSNKVIETLLESPLTIRWIDPVEGAFTDADLANINTPEDLRNLETKDH
jgi:molybdenum cofactor guanylyltransferase